MNESLGKPKVIIQVFDEGDEAEVHSHTGAGQHTTRTVVRVAEHVATSINPFRALSVLRRNPFMTSIACAYFLHVASATGACAVQQAAQALACSLQA